MAHHPVVDESGRTKERPGGRERQIPPRPQARPHEHCSQSRLCSAPEPAERATGRLADLLRHQGVACLAGLGFGHERPDAPEKTVTELVEPPDPRVGDATVLTGVARLAGQEQDVVVEPLVAFDVRG
jgi:hypothetical protein